jgi:hypothetical protein
VWGPRLKMSACKVRTRLPGYLLGSQASMWPVPGMVLRVATALLHLAWLLSLLMWGLMWMG